MAKNWRNIICTKHRLEFTAIVSLLLLAGLFIIPTVLHRSWMQTKISKLKVGMHTTDLVGILGEPYNKAYTVPQAWMPEALRNAKITFTEYEYLQPVPITFFIHEVWSVYLDDGGTILFIKPSPDYYFFLDGPIGGFLLFLGGILLVCYGLIAATVFFSLKHFCMRGNPHDLNADRK